MKNVIITTILACIASGSLFAQEICLKDTLEKVTIYNGKKKHKKLLGKGVRIPGCATSWTPDRIGSEIGSVINVDHPFEVEEIIFTTLSNQIESLELKIEIRPTEKLHTSILTEDIRINIPKGEKQKQIVTPGKQLIIEPGEYFVSLIFSNCDEETKKRWSENNENEKKQVNARAENILFPLYIKESYIRNNKEDEIESWPVNMGLKMNGIEYR